MPTLRFHGLPADRLAPLAADLTRDLAVIFETEEDNVRLEVIQTTVFSNGELDPSPYPMVEIVAFPRGEVIESEAARVLTETFRDAGIPYLEVFYLYPDSSRYFCDGEPCA